MTAAATHTLRWLFSGVDAKGRPTQGIVQARDAREALETIARKHPKVRQVQLHSIAADGEQIAPLAQHLYGQPPENLSPRQMRRLARTLISAQNNPEQPWRPLQAILQHNIPVWLTGLALLAWGLWIGSIWLLILAALVLAAPFIWFALMGRHTVWFHEGLRAAVQGDTQRVTALEEKLTQAALRPWATPPLRQAAWQLACYRLWPKARHSGLRGVMDELRAHPCCPKDEGQIALRTYNLHLAKGDYEHARTTLYTLLGQTPDQPELLMDCALAHALQGQAEEAQALLQRISPKTLPPFASLYFDWVNGLIALSQHPPQPAQATAMLGRACQELLRRIPNQPTLWLPLPHCTADLALALALNGQSAEAQKTLGDIWPLARNVVPPARLKMIRDVVVGQAQPPAAA